jgi:signal transduction histidine kinase/phage shock protein PspC (stress-responsive transcriptional regulator)
VFRRSVCHDAIVVDRIQRVPRSSDRIVGGVASGWAERWSVEPTVVRASIGLLSLAGGIGIALYGAMALWTQPPTSDPPSPSTRPTTDPSDVAFRRSLAIAAAALALLVTARSIELWPGDEIMIPAGAVAVGTALTWSKREHGQRRWLVRTFQIVAGVTMFAAGVLSLATRTGGLASVGASASAIAVVIGGLAMFGAPAIGRLLGTLDSERSERVREDERAIISAHLHDSVLQSLVLIQRTDDPRRMSAVARRQERQLRSWLYGTVEPGEPTSLHAAVEAVAVEVEDDRDVRVEAVVVGDHPLDEPALALVAALREAIVNAARHADVDRVDVFVEADSAELRGYVRDTGRGFDPDRVPHDRHGIRESIVGRVQRTGGEAIVTSAVGAGTEIELRVPRRQHVAP